MNTQNELLNADGLDEAISNNINDSRVRHELSNANDEFSNANGKLRKKLKDARDKIKNKLKHDRDAIKNKVKGARDKIKKIRKSIKEKVGKAGKKLRNRLRGALRKDIKFKIEHNIHGMATRLYPAIITPQEVTKKKFKKAFAINAKKVHMDFLSRWIKLGGTEAELKDAIIKGASKRLPKNPYKSADGVNDSDAFYDYITAPEDENEYSIDADEYESSADASPSDAVEEVPTKEETKKGSRGFFAWLKSLFHKHKADENPYEATAPESKTFEKDTVEDKGNEPSPSEANNDTLAEIDKTSVSDDAGGDTDEQKSDERTGKDMTDNPKSMSNDKILGMSKPVFWISTVLVASAIGFGIYKLAKRK